MNLEDEGIVKLTDLRTLQIMTWILGEIHFNGFLMKQIYKLEYTSYSLMSYFGLEAISYHCLRQSYFITYLKVFSSYHFCTRYLNDALSIRIKVDRLFWNSTEGLEKKENIFKNYKLSLKIFMNFNMQFILLKDRLAAIFPINMFSRIVFFLV